MPLEIKEKAIFFAFEGTAATAPFEQYPLLWAKFLLQGANGSAPADIQWVLIMDERQANYGCGTVRREANFENGTIDITASIEEYFFDTHGGPRSNGPSYYIEIENDKGLKAINKGDGYWELQGPIDQRIAAARFIFASIAQAPRPEPEVWASALGYRVDTLPTQVSDLIAHGKPEEAIAIIEELADLTPHVAVYAEAKALAGLYLLRPEWLNDGIETLQALFSPQWEWYIKTGIGPELLAGKALMEENVTEAELSLNARGFAENKAKPYSFVVYALVFLRLMRQKGWTPAQQHEWLAGIMNDGLPMFAYSFNPVLQEIESNK